MKRMIVYRNGWYKCKRCKAEFRIERNNIYSKTLCFCPYCGQQVLRERKKDEQDEYEL